MAHIYHPQPQELAQSTPIVYSTLREIILYLYPYIDVQILPPILGPHHFQRIAPINGNVFQVANTSSGGRPPMDVPAAIRHRVWGYKVALGRSTAINAARPEVYIRQRGIPHLVDKLEQVRKDDAMSSIGYLRSCGFPYAQRVRARFVWFPIRPVRVVSPTHRCDVMHHVTLMGRMYYPAAPYPRYWIWRIMACLYQQRSGYGGNNFSPQSARQRRRRRRLLDLELPRCSHLSRLV